MGICILGIGDCGTTTSTDISNITNNDTTINNSIKNIINQSCNMDTVQSNVMNIIGSTVKKLNATQKNSIEGMCIMQSVLDSSVSASVQQNLLDKIKSNVETNGALLGSPASNNTVIKSVTTNKNDIDNSKFNEVTKNCILNTKQSNLLNIIGSNVEDSNIDQANAAFMKCLSKHSDTTKITASALADTKYDTDNTAKTSGGDVLKSGGELAKGIGSGIGSALSGPFIIPLIVCVSCVVVCLVIIFVSMLSKSSDASPVPLSQLLPQLLKQQN